MAHTEAVIKTWVCPSCGYKQHHDPSDTQTMAETFPEPRYQGRPDNACPACYAGENPQRVRQTSMLELLSGDDLTQLGRQRVADDATLEATQIEELDERGNPVMEQVGSRYELRVNQSTREIYTEEVPVMAPKLIPIPEKELTELKEQAKRDRDELSKVAVKEV